MSNQTVIIHPNSRFYEKMHDFQEDNIEEGDCWHWVEIMLHEKETERTESDDFKEAA